MGPAVVEMVRIGKEWLLFFFSYKEATNDFMKKY